MHSYNQNLSKSSFINLVDNIDIKVDIDNQQYIVLLKRQPEKSFATLYLYDFKEMFWIKKIDFQYLEQLKTDLHLKTSTQNFTKCLMKSMQQNCHIEFSEKSANLLVKLQIGEGLTMNCPIELTTRLSAQSDQKGYKIILKLFMRQLYESKLAQERCLKKQIEQLKQKKQDKQKQENISKDNKYIKEVLNINEEKKDQAKNLKKRDLLNPNKAKRKHAGIKLGTPA